MKLTHIDENGKAKMVDVGEKTDTQRTATASGAISMKNHTLQMIVDNEMPKGDVFACARIAGIMAAKKTSDLIPMCHPLPISSVKIDILPIDDKTIQATATVKCTYKTGVEMEALTAVSVTLLTIYDMCKAVDKSMQIGEIKVLNKTGGKSGEYNAYE